MRDESLVSLLLRSADAKTVGIVVALDRASLNHVDVFTACIGRYGVVVDLGAEFHISLANNMIIKLLLVF